MKKAIKGMLITAIVLILTVGIFLMRFGVGTPAGLYWATYLDLFLALPLLPFLPLTLISPVMNIVVISVIASLVWLYVGYKIGAHLDKKSKK